MKSLEFPWWEVELNKQGNYLIFGYDAEGVEIDKLDKRGKQKGVGFL